MLRVFLASSLMGCLVSAGMIPYGSSPDTASAYGEASSDGGHGGGGGGGGYGEAPQARGGGGYGEAQQTRSRTRCTPFFETESHQQCEPWTERICRTTQKESCTDVEDRNCRALWKGSQNRKCFNVTEQHCSLKESVQFETVQVGFTVQKCQKVPERICDKIYEPQTTNQEDFQCVNIENPVCQSVDRTVYDKTCRTTTVFDCRQAPEAAPRQYGEDDSGYGGAPSQQESSGGYGGASSGGSSGGYGGGSRSDESSGHDYSAPAAPAYGAEHQPKQTRVSCTRRQEVKCYKTPRVVRQQQCTRQSDKVCERVSLASPVVKERQICHNEEKKVCVLEERTQPKQVKKYAYTKQCRTVPRRVCENADQKQLVPSCVETTRKRCTWNPMEQCEEVPKQHCFNVDRQVRRERCETVQEPAPSSGGYGGQQQAQAARSSGGYGGQADGGNIGYD